MQTKFKILIGVLLIIGSGFKILELDDQLAQIIKENRLSSYETVPSLDSAKVELGRMLFFDKVLSGNRDISCATCHHPGLNSGDNLALAIGVGGNGLGESRTMGDGRDRIPRNSPEIFNRGAGEWHTMFWDGRVSENEDGGFASPANEKLPTGLDNVLAAQAMFPVTSRDEMRGEIGDIDREGNMNELALISNAASQSVWGALMRRILSFPEYQRLFNSAYPNVNPDSLGFRHAANAIAAFEIDAFTFVDSPWDSYLDGETSALSEKAKRGALLFYGKANCVGCHKGNLFTDQEFHNIGVPQFGPGKDNAAPLDAGRFAETGNPRDRFAFRTPPLRNVVTTGPWMHNGAYADLEDVIKHHFYPDSALRNYDVGQLASDLQSTLKDDKGVLERIISNLDPLISDSKTFKQKEINELMAFMSALTDSTAMDLEHLVPAKVPSRLPVQDNNPQYK